MPIYNLGPRAQRVYVALRDRITSAELSVGTKLPPHGELAAQYGIAPLTVRQVLARLEEEGLVSREQGRGTFVRAQVRPAVLIVEDDGAVCGLLEEYVTDAGYRPIPAATAAEGLAHLAQDSSIALVFSDIRMPDKETGLDFIRRVRRRWPVLPVVAITGYPDDLAELHGTPECPVMILVKPFWANHINETLRLALRS